MEQLTEKQFKTINNTYNMIMFLFVVTIIMMIVQIVLLAINFTQNLSGDIVSLAGPFVEAAAYYILLFDKSQNREKKTAIALLVCVLKDAVVLTLNSIISKNTPYLSVPNTVLSILTGALFIYLCLLLLQKTFQKPITTKYLKAVFIAYVILYYLQRYLLIDTLARQLNPDGTLIIVTVISVGVVIGFLSIIFLRPQYAVYKGLTDSVFYNAFFVQHPKKAINRYWARKKQNEYCLHCGAWLEQDANFCRYCGKPAEKQQ